MLLVLIVPVLTALYSYLNPLLKPVTVFIYVILLQRGPQISYALEKNTSFANVLLPFSFTENFHCDLIFINSLQFTKPFVVHSGS